MFYRHSSISFITLALTFYSVRQMVQTGAGGEEEHGWQPHKQVLWRTLIILTAQKSNTSPFLALLHAPVLIILQIPPSWPELLWEGLILNQIGPMTGPNILATITMPET